MLIIRLARRGRKKQAFYDIVVAEKAKSVQKKFLEKLGYYNPLTESGKGEVIFDAEKVAKYIANGAQMSQTAARLLSKNGVKEAGKFIEQRSSKPKKEEPKPDPVEEPEAATEESPAEEAPAETAEEKPAEETV